MGTGIVTKYSQRVRMHRLWHWIRSQEISVMIALLVGLSCLWVFGEISDEVVERETQTFDEWVVKSLRNPEDLSQSIGPHWVQEAALDLTSLGSIAVLTFVTLAVAGYFLIQRQHGAMALVLIATGTGQGAAMLLKMVFQRQRPDIVPHLRDVASLSFPSNHAMLSAVVYLTLAGILARVLSGKIVRIYVIAIALLATFLVGASRVYLGVHYPTDVAAGWCAGLAWAILCWFVARTLQRKGVVEYSSVGTTESP
jgi:undecaprenyl-diphosphatase